MVSCLRWGSALLKLDLAVGLRAWNCLGGLVFCSFRSSDPEAFVMPPSIAGCTCFGVSVSTVMQPIALGGGRGAYLPSQRPSNNPDGGLPLNYEYLTP